MIYTLLTSFLLRIVTVAEIVRQFASQNFLRWARVIEAGPGMLRNKVTHRPHADGCATAFLPLGSNAMTIPNPTCPHGCKGIRLPSFYLETDPFMPPYPTSPLLHFLDGSLMYGMPLHASHQPGIDPKPLPGFDPAVGVDHQVVAYPNPRSLHRGWAWVMLSAMLTKLRQLNVLGLTDAACVVYNPVQPSRNETHARFPLLRSLLLLRQPVSGRRWRRLSGFKHIQDPRREADGLAFFVYPKGGRLWQ